MSAKPRVLLVEDEPEIRRFVKNALEAMHCVVTEADSVMSATHVLSVNAADLLVVDLGLPDVDGQTLIERVRSWSDMPVLVLSARAMEQDKVDALNLGADDYLTKPFGTAEFKARVQALLRRYQRQEELPTSLLSFGTVRVDFTKREIFKGDEPVHLTVTEFKLLAALVKSSGKVMTQKTLLQEVWGPAFKDSSHYLRIYISHLRRKLEEDPSRPKHFVTEIGVGYRFKP
jgi:two-component system KDP operon response regulator KdpE